MLTAEQILAAQKSNIETLNTLGQTAFEGVEKLVELNLQVAKASFAEGAEKSRAAFSVKSAEELLALQAALVQPSAEKLTAYSRHVYDIVSSTGAELNRVVEAKTAEFQKSFLAAVDSAVQNAPAGTDGAIQLVKSAVDAATAAFADVQKAGKQAAEAAEANFQAMTSTALKATQAPKAKRAA